MPITLEIVDDLMYVTTYAYLLTLAITGISGLIRFKVQSIQLKILVILVWITFFVECAAFSAHLIHLPNNFDIYNLFRPIEFALYGWYFYKVIRFYWFRSLLFPMLIFYACFSYFSAFQIFHFAHWNSYGSLLEAIGIISLCIIYYYQLFVLSPLTSLRFHSGFWIATGLMFFYACSLPYTGMLNFLVTNSTKYYQLAEALVIIFQIFNIILYSVFTYAFYAGRISRSSLGAN